MCLVRLRESLCVLRWILKADVCVCLFESLFPFHHFPKSTFGHRAACPRSRRDVSARYGEDGSSRRAGSDAADQVCARFATGSATTAPPELKSLSGVLEVTFKFLTATDSQGLVRYCYVTDTGLEAPTLRVNPGDQLIIHFQNDLPAASASSASDNMAGMKMSLSSNATTSSSSACNGAMSATATNIHFHGTNVSPVCGQDEVVHTLIQPGQSFDYNVQIPQNEPPGLYWYHPHPHGFSEGQVQGGATGALIVEGLQNVDPALAGLTERTFVIRDQLLPASEANDTNIPAWDLSINYVPVTYPSYTPAVIQTNPSQQELWRVANTAADTILNLQYVVNGTPQAMQVVAIDGYPIASGSSGQPSESETSILLPPGARAEFVVTTPSVGYPGAVDYSELGYRTGWGFRPHAAHRQHREPKRRLVRKQRRRGQTVAVACGANPGHPLRSVSSRHPDRATQLCISPKY